MFKNIKMALLLIIGLTTPYFIQAKEIDKRLVGVWEGQRDKDGKCAFMAWEFKRFENGRFEVYFFKDKNKIKNFLDIETGTWATEGNKYKLSTDGVPNPDIYIYDVIDNNTIEFTNIQRDPSSDCSEDYKFVDHRIDKSLTDNSFSSNDFKGNPTIPVNANTDRYVGKWADIKTKVIQVEVKKDSAGNAIIFNEGNENWNFLFNDVRWVGDELHYKSFAYSTKPSLFTHPFHKSVHQAILAPFGDVDKIKHSYFIGGKRFDNVLIKTE